MVAADGGAAGAAHRDGGRHVNPLRVLLVDPSLFTGPYDAALTEGLLQIGVEPTWAVRPTRASDRSELPETCVDAFFYRWVDQQELLAGRLRDVAKGVAHAWGLARLVGRVARRRPHVVHFQWTVVPLLDCVALLLIRRMARVVLTVHDTVPFNGERLSFWQNWGVQLPIRLSHRVIVHTRAGQERLLARGTPLEKLAVIPHGPLSLRARPRPVPDRERDERYCFVLFGELKPYKGIDVLLDALSLLPPELRALGRVVIAGRARMDLEPIRSQIQRLGLGGVVELRAQRLSEQEMADLFEQADSFVFPYRQIDASGVYFLVKGLGKWLIASRVGVFAEEMTSAQGELVPSEDVSRLASALARALRERPRAEPDVGGSAWLAIARQTRALYDDAADSPALSASASPQEAP
jgi:glycosyltransferase involved in cell wall biosynthesis